MPPPRGTRSSSWEGRENVVITTDAIKLRPAPGRSVLGRAKDDHAAERARLTAAVGAADQQLDALERHRRAAVREVGRNLQEIRGERDGLDSQIEELQRARAGVRDAGADGELAGAPWAGCTPSASRPRKNSSSYPALTSSPACRGAWVVALEPAVTAAVKHPERKSRSHSCRPAMGSSTAAT